MASNNEINQDDYLVDPVDRDILNFDFENFYRFLEDEAVTEEDVEKICDEVRMIFCMARLHTNIT